MMGGHRNWNGDDAENGGWGRRNGRKRKKPDPSTADKYPDIHSTKVDNREELTRYIRAILT